MIKNTKFIAKEEDSLDGCYFKRKYFITNETSKYCLQFKGQSETKASDVQLQFSLFNSDDQKNLNFADLESKKILDFKVVYLNAPGDTENSELFYFIHDIDAVTEDLSNKMSEQYIYNLFFNEIVGKKKIKHFLDQTHLCHCIFSLASN